MRALLSLIFLFGISAHAAEFKIDVSPARPIVANTSIAMIDGSIGTVLMGHWFVMNLYLKNEFSEPMVIDSIQVHIKSTEGNFATKTLAIDPQELGAGAAVNLQRLYVDGLPDSASFVYSLSLELRGHKGTLASVGDRAVFTKFFTTQ